MDSLKPSRRKSDATVDLEQLTSNLLPLLASVLPPDLMNSLKTESTNNEFNLDKIVDMLPTLMVLLPRLINSNDSTSRSTAQLSDTTNTTNLKNQVAKVLPLLINALQDLSGTSSDELTQQLTQFLTGLKDN